MTHPSNAGIKKSVFPGNANPGSSDTFDFVSQGVNYRIAFSDFVAALGVTGTIVQDGDPLGVPILDPQGAVNNIRNIEAGAGIAASVSPQNGLALKTVLLPSAGGVNTLFNETTSPQFRSITAGSGISIAQAGDNIQITSVSGAPVTTKTVIVDTINDFPTAVGGVITLVDDTEYFLINDISTANRFVMGDNCSLNAGHPAVITLTYTGVDAMITASGVGESGILNIGLNAATGSIFDISNGKFTMDFIRVISCVTIGVINVALRVVINRMLFESIATGGITFTGANKIFASDYVRYQMNSAGTLFDLATATFDNLTFTGNVFELDNTITLLSGAAGSANVNAGRVATMMNNRIGGDGPITTLAGVTADDERWQFALNDLIKDTTRRGLLSTVGNATATIIATINTPVLIAGVWVIGPESGYTGDANGRLTYNSPKPIDARITAHVSAIKESGGDQIYSYYVAKNGTIIPDSKIGATLTSVDTFPSTVIWTEPLVAGDYLELFVENNGNTNNVTIVDSQFRVD